MIFFSAQNDGCHIRAFPSRAAHTRARNLLRRHFYIACLLLLIIGSCGCDPYALDLQKYPEAGSVLLCETRARDPGHIKFGAGVCARTADGKYVLITAGHMAFAADSPSELKFNAIDVFGDNRIGQVPPDDLRPYIASISHIPELDLAVYVLKEPIQGVHFVDVASQIPPVGGVVAFGSKDAGADGLYVHTLQGKLTGISSDRKSLLLALGANKGDSGGGVFRNGRLVGIIVGASAKIALLSPFYFTFEGPVLQPWSYMSGPLVQGDTVAVAVTQSTLATAIDRSSSTRFNDSKDVRYDGNATATRPASNSSPPVP
jgi:hypothetical protein